MKKFLISATAFLLVFSIVFFCGCDNKKTSSKSQTKATQKQAQTGKYSSAQLKTYLDSFVKGDNPLYGTWKIKGIKSFSYIFRNDGLGEIALGTEADFAKLSIDTKKQTLGVAFVLGLNGTYNYTLSNDNKTLTLKNDQSSFTLLKQKDYNLIPKPKKNPKTDNDILGWWQCDGNVFYFADDGIMYSNTITMETCYNYNAENGKINAVYKYDGDVKISMKYSYKNNKLNIDGDDFTKFTPDCLK